MVSVDPSPAFITHAREQVRDPRVRFELGDARALPFADGAFDAIVSGLVLNFVPQPEQVVLEMNRVTRPGGTVATYVWDYTGKMEMKRHFWDAAAALDPAARELDEGLQYALCKAGPIGNLFRGAGLGGIDVRAIDVPTHFQDFDDYWSPFLGGQAPAPRYAMSLDEERRTALRERVRSNLPFAPDGSIHLVARAWAVRGRNAPPAASGSGNVSPVRR
jgi:SAM-dependent methyltransferase